jgi:hypothetical protein
VRPVEDDNENKGGGEGGGGAGAGNDTSTGDGTSVAVAKIGETTHACGTGTGGAGDWGRGSVFETGVVPGSGSGAINAEAGCRRNPGKTSTVREAAVWGLSLNQGNMTVLVVYYVVGCEYCPQQAALKEE